MLSSRARYASRALLELSLAYPCGPMLIHDIADRQKIPLKYLQKILFDLKKAGLLISRKGPGGGYVLARSPDRINLGQVLDAMDDGIAKFCGSDQGSADCGCPQPDSCALHAAIGEVAANLRKNLDRVTFADLSERHRALVGQAISDFVI